MDVLHAHLTDGLPICIRRVQPDDEQRLKDGIALLTPQSRYFRFFSGMREAPQRVVDALANADGHDHIAWGALRTDRSDTPALGVVHAFRESSNPAEAEFSVAIIDEYHGRGLARLLTAVLLLDCRREGLDRLTLHILAANDAALALARTLGAELTGSDHDVLEFLIDIGHAIGILQADRRYPGLQSVFDGIVT